MHRRYRVTAPRPGRGPAWLGAAWLALAVGGCAAISGLNDITEQACEPNCDGGVGGSTGDATQGGGTDGTVSHDDSGGSPDTGAIVEDTSVGQGNDTGTGEMDSGGSDASVADAPEDAPIVDAGVDAPPSHDAAPSDDCGALDTPENCSACGAACATASLIGAPACNGTTCLYTCAANHIDCNISIAPDLDGCECNAPTGTACCGTGCPISHTYDSMLDASVATYYSCTADGTYNQTTAKAACAAYTGSAAQCDRLETFDCLYPDGGVAGDMVCANGSSKDCGCWGYDGVIQGLMTIGAASGDNNCNCPELGSPTWN